MRLRLSCLSCASLICLLGAAPARAARAPDPLRAAIEHAELAGELDSAGAARYREIDRLARGVLARVRGVRRAELRGVLADLRDIAARGHLTASRMPAAFLVLRRNAEWWAVHGIPPAGGSPGEKDAIGRICRPFAAASRVVFPGSQLVFQYYPGHGLALQPLATFATANALWARADARGDAALVALLDELIGLASRRARGLLTWEYFFPFGGGLPPWTSAISQAVAIQALARAGVRLGRADYLDVAAAALDTLATPAPAGVLVGLGRDGHWFANYSFAPALRVLNVHMFTLAALFDYHEATRDERAHTLYRDGLRAARRRIARYDTGSWSRYASPGALADLNYHVANRDAVRGVCKRSGEAAICRAAERFTAYLERRCPRVRSTEGPASAGPSASNRRPR